MLTGAGIAQELVLSMWYASLHPGDAVTTTTFAISGENVTHDAHLAMLLSHRRSRVGVNGTTANCNICAIRFGNFLLQIQTEWNDCP